MTVPKDDMVRLLLVYCCFPWEPRLFDSVLSCAMMKPAWALHKNLKLHSSVKGVVRKYSFSTLTVTMRRCIKETFIQ